MSQNRVRRRGGQRPRSNRRLRSDRREERHLDLKEEEQRLGHLGARVTIYQSDRRRLTFRRTTRRSRGEAAREGK